MAATMMVPTMTVTDEWSAAAKPVGMFIGTPEIYFSKRLDNSRLVRVADPKRRREMISFSVALAFVFLFAMVYVWQHFSSIEYGYKIEQLKAQRDTIVEANRVLKLEEASLKDPARIDRMARDLGMEPPIAGQVQNIESGNGDSGGPVMAKASGIMVVSLQP